MDSQEQISLYFVDLASNSEVIDSVTARDENRWDISALSHQVQIEAVFQTEENLLALTSRFRRPDSNEALGTYAAMLTVNGETQDMAGLRMAIAEDETPIQVMHLNPNSLDLQSLTRKCEYFAIQAALWLLARFNGGINGNEPLAEYLQSILPDAGLIRG